MLLLAVLTLVTGTECFALQMDPHSPRTRTSAHTDNNSVDSRTTLSTVSVVLVCGSFRNIHRRREVPVGETVHFKLSSTAWSPGETTEVSNGSCRAAFKFAMPSCSTIKTPVFDVWRPSIIKQQIFRIFVRHSTTKIPVHPWSIPSWSVIQVFPEDPSYQGKVVLLVSDDGTAKDDDSYVSLTC